MDDRTPRRNRFLDQAAPALRRLDAAIAGNDDLREARDLIADRMADVAKQAAEAIKGGVAPDIVEGTVHEGDSAGGATVAPAAPVAPDGDAPVRAASTHAGPRAVAQPRDAAGRAPHWNRARIGRMVAAAGREAVRPQRTELADRRFAIGAAAVFGVLVVWRVVRRRSR